MPPHPISVPRDGYRGSNPSRKRKAAEFNRVAEKLEAHINRAMADSEEDRHVFIYGFLAQELRLTERQVREAFLASVVEQALQYGREAVVPNSRFENDAFGSELRANARAPQPGR